MLTEVFPYFYFFNQISGTVNVINKYSVPYMEKDYYITSSENVHCTLVPYQIINILYIYKVEL